MSANLVIEILLGLLTLVIGYASFHFATKSMAIQGGAVTKAVDAQAFARAKDIYDGAMDTLRTELDAARADLTTVRSELVSARSEIVGLRAEVVRLGDEIHRLRLLDIDSGLDRDRSDLPPPRGLVLLRELDGLLMPCQRGRLVGIAPAEVRD